VYTKAFYCEIYTLSHNIEQLFEAIPDNGVLSGKNDQEIHHLLHAHNGFALLHWRP